MQIRETKKLEYVLNEKEWEMVEKGLKYCKHRLNKHPNCGAHKAGLKEEEIREILFDIDFEKLDNYFDSHFFPEICK